MTTPSSTGAPVTDGERPFMSTREVSALTSVTQSTLRYWRHCNEGPPSFVLGRRVVYRRAAVLEWIQQQEQATRRGGHPISSQG